MPGEGTLPGRASRGDGFANLAPNARHHAQPGTTAGPTGAAVEHGHKCDCLIHCGDDPWLKTGKAVPCERAQQKARDEQARAEQLRADTLTLNGLLARLRRTGRCRDEVAALERLMRRGLW